MLQATPTARKAAGQATVTAAVCEADCSTQEAPVPDPRQHEASVVAVGLITARLARLRGELDAASIQEEFDAASGRPDVDRVLASLAAAATIALAGLAEYRGVTVDEMLQDLALRLAQGPEQDP